MNSVNWIFLLLTILAWGIAPIVEKSALKNVAPLDGLFVRSVAVFLIFLLFFIFTGRIKSITDIPFKAILLFTLSGVLAGLLGMYTYFRILKLNPSSQIVPLVATYPLITVVISMLFFKEDLSWQRIAGTVLIVAGVLLVK